MEVEVTAYRIIRLGFSFVWRYILALICWAIVAFAGGIALAFLMRLFSVSHDSVDTYIKLFGVVVILVLPVVPIVWMLGRSFGDFRLVLISNKPALRPAYSDSDPTGAPARAPLASDNVSNHRDPTRHKQTDKWIS